MQEHIGYGDADAGNKAGPHGGPGHALPVQAIEEGGQESACQRSPGDSHKLGDEIRGIQGQDDANEDKKDDQNLHEQKLGSILHIPDQSPLNEIQRQGGAGSKHQGGEGGHGGGEDQHHHGSDENIRKPGQHGRHDGIIGHRPLGSVDLRTVIEASETAQKITSSGDHNGKDGGNHGSGGDSLLAAYGVELVNHLRKPPGAQGGENDDAKKIHRVRAEEGGVGSGLPEGQRLLTGNLSQLAHGLGKSSMLAKDA